MMTDRERMLFTDKERMLLKIQALKFDNKEMTARIAHNKTLIKQIEKKIK